MTYREQRGYGGIHPHSQDVFATLVPCTAKIARFPICLLTLCKRLLTSRYEDAFGRLETAS